MKKLFSYPIFLFIIFILFANSVFANIGVGVNTGKIQVDEKLQSGMVYELPPITVINTGDQPSDYETTISYHNDQPELRPKQDWFIFTPQKFYLDPGKTQRVEITINLPLNIEPGNYFAYLEAHPIASVQKGTTNLGVAAASKLYFTVIPANIFYGIYYKIAGFWQLYTPWPERVLYLAAFIILATTFKKFFNIQINFKKPQDKESSHEIKKIKIKNLKDQESNE